MPKVFGKEHLLFMATFLLLSVGSLIIVKKFLRTKKTISLVVKIVAFLLFVSITLNRISLSVFAKDALSLVPNSFCGTTSLLLSLCALFVPNKNHNVFHFLVYAAVFGGFLSTVYPDYIGQAESIFNPKTISGLMHHALALYLAVLIIATGDFKPSLKKWWCLIFGLCAYTTYGLLMNQVLNRTNFMNINKPLLANSPFTWYFMGFLLILLQTIFLICYELFLNKRQRKHINHT